MTPLTIQLSDEQLRRLHELAAREKTSPEELVRAHLEEWLGDFDRAEEALHDAFRAALEQWPRDGMPSNPRTWLVSAGRTPRTGRVQGAVRGEAGLREGARRSDGGLPLRVESIARGVPPG